MTNFTTKVLSVALLAGAFCTVAAFEKPEWKTRIQPAAGTLYSGSNATSLAEPDAEYEYDSHGNETLKSTGSFSSMSMEEHEYNYDKGYAVLMNHFYYTMDKTGYHDTTFMTKTTLDENGIRIGYETSPSYEKYDNFTFDAEGHITSLNMDGDTRTLTWNGDRLATYDHHTVSSSSESQVKYDNVEVVFSYSPINCMGYDFDNLISDFSESGAFVNAKGYYVRYISWYEQDMRGELEVKTEIIGEDSIKSIATVATEGKETPDTLYAQYFKMLDANGSYRLRVESPLLNGSYYYYDIEKWYNEFGDVVKTVRTDYYSGNGFATISGYPVEYDGDKPLNKKYYYYQEGEPMLGSATVYTAWHESEDPGTGISEVKSTADETTAGAIYDLNGRKIADLSGFQISTGRYNAPTAGVYVIRENTPQGVKTRKVTVK